MTDESNWPQYVSHKIVRALPIIGIPKDATYVLVGSSEPDCMAFEPTEPAMLKHAEIGGYAVIYQDGFKSISPKAAFESGYSPLHGEAKPSLS